MKLNWLDKRPIVVAIAGSNGAGKTTFYYSHLSHSGLRFVNADQLGKETDIDAYTAAKLADNIRRELVKSGESFVFETVFSDPVGEKVQFLKQTSERGYAVGLCFIGIDSPEVSEERVAMRVSQGGHDVPAVKLKERFPRTLENLKAAISDLPHVLLFDNSHFERPFELIAIAEQGDVTRVSNRHPVWLDKVL